VAHGDDGHATHGSASETVVKLDIDPAILAQFDALPNSKYDVRFRWTDQLDALLLRYWPKKRKVDVAKLIGTSESKCRERWEELTK